MSSDDPRSTAVCESRRTRSQESVSRREFLKSAIAGAVVPSILLGQTKKKSPGSGSVVPSHLPPRLAICYYGWQWITTALPDEAFGKLEAVMRETKERGFNCVRAEMGLNWMFDLQGRRRGKMRFTSWIPGFSDNLQCVNARGGAEYDVFDRVMQLFELAAKNDLYIITTSWEYQDSLSQVADPRIRDEILAVPYSERLMLLARQYDRLLDELRRRGLHKRIAQVEIINELNQPPIVCSTSKLPPESFWEWTHGHTPHPLCSTEAVRTLAYAAVNYLRQRHPDLLITIDGLVACRGFETLYPRNAQVADHHVYCDGLTQAFWKKCGISGITPGTPPDPSSNPFLRSMLKPDPVAWADLVRNAGRVRQNWWGISWLYSNLDNEKFDRWCLQHFGEYEQRIRNSIYSQFKCAADFANSNNLPLVVDEGFILYPPLHSRFVATPEGRRAEEFGTTAAIATGHWGIMITAYFRPDTPLWRDDGQCAWAKGLNQKVIASTRTASRQALNEDASR